MHSTRQKQRKSQVLVKMIQVPYTAAQLNHDMTEKRQPETGWDSWHKSLEGSLLAFLLIKSSEHHLEPNIDFFIWPFQENIKWNRTHILLLEYWWKYMMIGGGRPPGGMNLSQRTSLKRATDIFLRQLNSWRRIKAGNTWGLISLSLSDPSTTFMYKDNNQTKKQMKRSRESRIHLMTEVELTRTTNLEWRFSDTATFFKCSRKSIMSSHRCSKGLSATQQYF